MCLLCKEQLSKQAASHPQHSVSHTAMHSPALHVLPKHWHTSLFLIKSKLCLILT